MPGTRTPTCFDERVPSGHRPLCSGRWDSDAVLVGDDPDHPGAQLAGHPWPGAHVRVLHQGCRAAAAVVSGRSVTDRR
jgi:uracil-DNA glycosylase